jgi:hypothetical protein
MRFLLLAALGWLFASSTLVAQNIQLPTEVSGFYVKASPLAMLETDGGITIAAEYLMSHPRLGFQLEVQPIFFSLSNINGQEGRQAPVNTQSSGMPLGIELRPELRYYFTFDKMLKTGGPLFRFSKDKGTTRYKSTGRRNYIAVDFLYKYAVRQRQSELNVFNGGTNPAYIQQYTYKDVKQVTGLSLKFGTVRSISNNGKWLLEYYIGIGSRHKTFSYKNIPVGVAPPNRRSLVSFFANRNGNQIMEEDGVSIPAGVKLVYQL